MSSSYRDRIIQNLHNLLNVALFHPRLAMVGVESELECMMTECVLEWLLDEWIEAPLQHGGNPLIPSVVIRRKLKSLGKLYWKTDVMDRLSNTAGNSRHSRADIEFHRVVDAVNEVVGFVKYLATERPAVPSGMCDSKNKAWAGFHEDLDFSPMMHSEPSRHVEVSCLICQKTIESAIILPDPDEASGRHVHSDDERRQLQSEAQLVRAVWRLVGHVFEIEGLSDEECAAKVNALKAILPESPETRVNKRASGPNGSERRNG